MQINTWQCPMCGGMDKYPHAKVRFGKRYPFGKEDDPTIETKEKMLIVLEQLLAKKEDERKENNFRSLDNG